MSALMTHIHGSEPTIIILTVNEHESTAVLNAFIGKGKAPEQETAGSITYNHLGIHGGMRLIHTICEMGSGGVGAAQQRTGEAIAHWNPAAVIAVGIAFGIDEDKQKIGDVLVATQVQDYDLGRVNEDGSITPRGDKPSTSDPLCNRIKQTDLVQKQINKPKWPKIRYGLVLSGQKLVDNYDYRESLKQIAGTEIIGGEMEGVGVYVAACKHKVDWIVIKAICDWGHHKNRGEKDKWQKLAAKNAVLVLKTAIDVGTLFPGGVGADSFKKDISALKDLTRRNLTSLRKHNFIHFGLQPTDEIHIRRDVELNTLIAAIRKGHLLLTGEPGCGKSSLIYELVQKLQAENVPIVLILADDFFGPSGALNRFSKLSEPVEEVLKNWSNSGGVFITDALDAVRDVEAQKYLRRLLCDIKAYETGWTVIASVREFDLKHGRILREEFPGNGVEGYGSAEFNGVSHFYLNKLTENQVDELCSKYHAIVPFVQKARTNPKSAGVYRSPFYLSLAADLLKAGVSPARLSDWNSPAVLLRKFWDARVDEQQIAGARESLLTLVCSQMVASRNMSISTKELSLKDSNWAALQELRSRGILLGPKIRHGTSIGSDDIRFTHHLLHDYAVARALIPSHGEQFIRFVERDPLLPIFYRQSFLFALEELWDADESHTEFWGTAIKLEGIPTLHALTRILAPILAARRIESFSDLQPLLDGVSLKSKAESPPLKTLRHLASGLQDVGEEAISIGVVAWSSFAERLATLLPKNDGIEGPLVHILAVLKTARVGNDHSATPHLNSAARGLLHHHAKKPVSKGWRYAAHVAIEIICQTFDSASIQNEEVLLSLLSPARLAQFPHDDLHDLSNNLKYLPQTGDNVIVKVFESAFIAEPEKNEWSQMGSSILSLKFQTSDQWNLCRYVLAEFYKASTERSVALMTEIACIAWNSVPRRRNVNKDTENTVITTIKFRGFQCPIVEDWGHIWGRGYDHDEQEILSHFESLLRVWAVGNNGEQLKIALDVFARCNRTSQMWTVLMEVGAENPRGLGALIQDVLKEPTFLSHPDYIYGGTKLLGALHATSDSALRIHLEQLILDLPQKVRLRKGQRRKPVSSWVIHAQGRLLGVLEPANIVREETRELLRVRCSAETLPFNQKPEGTRVTSRALSEADILAMRGIDLNENSNKELFKLRDALKILLPHNGNEISNEKVEGNWHIIQKCQIVLRKRSAQQSDMYQDLWGHLVGACENIAKYVTWPSSDKRWQIVKRILLKAATDPFPKIKSEDDIDDGYRGWGWPAPRIDAAGGLPFVVSRIGHLDRLVGSALRRLCTDLSQPLRINLADRLSFLYQPAPEFMWKLVDIFIKKETKFSVLNALLLTLDQFWTREPVIVMTRLQQIACHVKKRAPIESEIHETLAQMYLFRFLRHDNTECQKYIDELIDNCDFEPFSKALQAQLHTCREGGWMTVDEGVVHDANYDRIRRRTWTFILKLASVAQERIHQHRSHLRHLHEQEVATASDIEQVQRKLDAAAHLVDKIALQLYFACGAFDGKRKIVGKEGLNSSQLQLFWQESFPVFSILSEELHPHTVYNIIQSLRHLLPYGGADAFLLATKSILSSAKTDFIHDSLAVAEVVKLIQQALADHREIFHNQDGKDSAPFVALLDVLDLFVDAGWQEARQLTHRLEEIYR
ncbi:MAG: hypothetical protein A2076_11410 [Geobacteraceae bacterium GWC2_53_11]|nr:MAG: hypothetical protein A2076_11410 [Geobacteraceae bacterium GWC2_53_11]